MTEALEIALRVDLAKRCKIAEAEVDRLREENEALRAQLDHLAISQLMERGEPFDDEQSQEEKP